MEQEEFSIFSDQPTVVYAGFWERFAASFLDGILLSVVNFILNYTMTGHLIARGFHPLPLGLGIVVSWLYCALQESSANQATIGKKALGIKVTDLAGGRISFGRATGRHFAKNISAIILCIGYLMMLWNDKKQTLHDQMAGTLVVMK